MGRRDLVDVYPGGVLHTDFEYLGRRLNNLSVTFAGTNAVTGRADSSTLNFPWWSDPEFVTPWLSPPSYGSICREKVVLTQRCCCRQGSDARISLRSVEFWVYGTVQRVLRNEDGTGSGYHCDTGTTKKQVKRSLGGMNICEGIRITWRGVQGSNDPVTVRLSISPTDGVDDRRSLLPYLGSSGNRHSGYSWPPPRYEYSHGDHVDPLAPRREGR